MLIDGIELFTNADIKNTSVDTGPTLPANPDDGELFYKTTGDIGLYVHVDGIWTKLGVDTELVNHAANDAVHLTPTQNVFLDNITPAATDINQLSGVTSNIQDQIDNKLGNIIGVENDLVQIGLNNIIESSGNTLAALKNTRRNYIINGGFDVWQRGTNFTQSSAFSADRWLINGAVGTQGTFNITRQNYAIGQVDVPGNPTFFLRWDQTLSQLSDLHTLSTRIEDVRTLAGKEVTLSFFARVNTGIFSRPINIIQNFGTLGSADVLQVLPSLTLNGVWQSFVYTFTLGDTVGKTIGENSFLEIQFETPTNGTFQFDLSGVQLELGNSQSPFEEKPFEDEISACQRYYYKSHDYDIVPGSAIVGNGFIENSITNMTSFNSTYQQQMSWNFPVTMRTTPTIITYSALNDIPNTIDGAITQNLTPVVIFNGESSVSIEVNEPVSGNGRTIGCYITAEAEL